MTSPGPSFQLAELSFLFWINLTGTFLTICSRRVSIVVFDLIHHDSDYA
jgi:hypothetical protein